MNINNFIEKPKQLFISLLIGTIVSATALSLEPKKYVAEYLIFSRNNTTSIDSLVEIAKTDSFKNSLSSKGQFSDINSKRVIDNAVNNIKVLIPGKLIKLRFQGDSGESIDNIAPKLASEIAELIKISSNESAENVTSKYWGSGKGFEDLISAEKIIEQERKKGGLELESANHYLNLSIIVNSIKQKNLHSNLKIEIYSNKAAPDNTLNRNIGKFFLIFLISFIATFLLLFKRDQKKLGNN